MSQASPSSHSVIFDLESAPLDADYLDMIAPEFSAPANYKDEDKIAANIAEQRLKWMDRAALSPMTGKVLCIGIRDLDGAFGLMDGNGDEKALLMEFAKLVEDYKNETFLGWNCWGFDIDFMVRRALHHGIKPCIRLGADYWRQDQIVDLMTLWQGKNRDIPCALDAVSKFLGLPGKTGNGKDFAGLWTTDREAARKYLENDTTLTWEVGKRLGAIV